MPHRCPMSMKNNGKRQHKCTKFKKLNFTAEKNNEYNISDKRRKMLTKRVVDRLADKKGNVKCGNGGS